jgi:HTH domain
MRSRDYGFSKSGRPVRVSGFDYDALEGDDRHVKSLEQRYAVSEWFRVRYEWIMRARTMQSQQIRWALVQAEISGRSASTIAKRFGVTRQSVHEQLKELRNLTPSVIGKND